MMHPYVGREHAALSVTDESQRRSGDEVGLTCLEPDIAVNIAHLLKLSTGFVQASRLPRSCGALRRWQQPCSERDATAQS